MGLAMQCMEDWLQVNVCRAICCSLRSSWRKLELLSPVKAPVLALQPLNLETGQSGTRHQEIISEMLTFQDEKCCLKVKFSTWRRL